MITINNNQSTNSLSSEEKTAQRVIQKAIRAYKINRKYVSVFRHIGIVEIHLEKQNTVKTWFSVDNDILGNTYDSVTFNYGDKSYKSTDRSLINQAKELADLIDSEENIIEQLDLI
jgi:dihydroxyacetone kinase-like predicted kinase